MSAADQGAGAGPSSVSSPDATAIDGAARAGAPHPGVRLERRGPCAWLILDRPPLNVLDIGMLEEMSRLLAELAADDDLSVVVLAAAGKAFCAGVDVADHMDERAPLMLHAFHDVIEQLLALRPPLVAAVNGAALGGGCELLLACNVVLARAGAKLGQPEIRLGVFPPAAAALLPALVGRQRALDLILTGRLLSAEEALPLGLVTRVFAADRFHTEVDAWVADLASLSRPVLRLAKRAVMRSTAATTHALAAAEHIYLTELLSLDDAHEGLVAFLEKRPPVWKGA